MSDASDLLNQPDGDHAAEGVETPGTGVEWTSTELQSIATTIEDLQRRLEAANSQLSTTANVEATESEIGRLFVEAQRFSEESLSKLELQIHEILCAAEEKAKAILTEATQEAIEIRRQAQEAAFLSTKTAQELQSAIAGFTTVNNELVKELGALNSMLTPAGERGMTQIDPSSSEAGSG
jgi:cell division septum initiation protein DivIVA